MIPTPGKLVIHIEIDLETGDISLDENVNDDHKLQIILATLAARAVMPPPRPGESNQPN